MSITREEAIKELERLLSHWDDLENGKRSFRWYSKDAVGLAITALRPVSREQVRRGEWEKIGADYRGQGGIWRCTECRKTYPYKCDFCPNCGAPMTDEAVEIRLKELEALELLKMRWDMILAFPPCTYLSNAGAKHLFRGGVLNQERYQKGLEAKEFFMSFLNADCPYICVENPVPSRIFEMPPHTQEVQPWMFGHPVQKKTRLWLKGLPPLEPTNVVDPKCGCHEAGTWFMKGGKDRQKNRAKTFPGLAKAMAKQWGSIYPPEGEEDT